MKALVKVRHLWIALFAFHFLAAIAGYFSKEMSPDEMAYVGLATNIAERGSYSLDFDSLLTPAHEPNAHYAPGWPALLAVPIALGLGRLGLFLVLAIVWCANSRLAARLAREMELASRWRWALVAWITLNPIYLYYHTHLMSEPLSLGLGLLLFILGFRFLRAPLVETAAPFGLTSGLAYLVCGQLMLVALAIWILVVLRMPWKKWLRLLPVFVIAHLIVISPWLLRMHAVGADGLLPERKLGLNLFLFNPPDGSNPYAEADPRFPHSIGSLSPADRDQTLLRLAVQGMFRHPRAYLGHCLWRLGYLLSPVASFARATRLEDWGLALATVAFFYALWLAVFFKLAAGERPERHELALLAAVALWYLFHVLITASIRDRTPSDAWLAVAAASLLSRAGIRRESKLN